MLWPRSLHGRARYTWMATTPFENFFDAAIRSLQAVEAALRVRFDAGEKTPFARLIDRAKAEGLVDDYAHDILHTGRRLRNSQIHATTLSVFNPAAAARVIASSHKLVAELFEAPQHAPGTTATS